MCAVATARAQMPERYYREKATPTQRDFVQQIAHAAGSVPEIASYILLGPRPALPDTTASYATRAGLRAYINAAYDYGANLLHTQPAADREAIRRRPLPAEWRAIMDKNVPYVACLPSEDRVELAGHIQIFLAEQQFEGCGGLQITDEIRVTIAAHSILIYPSTYVVPGGRPMPGGLMTDDPEARLGESWVAGVVVLVWDSVRSGASDIHDGYNVVLHEFVHRLDQESGAGDGAPIRPVARCMWPGRVSWATTSIDWCATRNTTTPRSSISTAPPIRPSSLPSSPKRSSRSPGSCDRSIRSDPTVVRQRTLPPRC